MASSSANFNPDGFRKDFGGTYEGEDGVERESEFSSPDASNDDTYDHIPFADDIGRGRDGMSEEDWKNHPSAQDVQDYVAQIKKWTGGERYIDGDGAEKIRLVSEDADLVEEIKAERQRLSDQILREDGLFHPDLIEYKDYLQADFENLRKPKAAETQYSEYMLEEAHLYDRVLGEENLVGAETYQKATENIAAAISSGDDISDHYGMLRVRREAALQHFDDVRFIAEVALFKDGALKDEMMVDFDRTDLIDGKTNKARSKILAEVFCEGVSDHPDSDAPVSAKVKSFQKMREQAHSMRSNQSAIMHFAENFRDDAEKRELGLSALENVSYSDPVFNKWFKSFDNKADARNLKRTHLAVFDAACKRFEKEFDAGDPNAALSFAVMEYNGRAINKSIKLSRQAAEGDLQYGRTALNLFGDRWKEANVDTVSKDFEDKVLLRMGDSTLTGEKIGLAVIDEGEKDEPWNLDLSSAKSVEVEDGGHLKITNAEGKTTIMKLAGMDVPKVGVQTKSGMIDAGMNAKRHLTDFFNRYGEENISLEIVENDKGESRLRARLPSGEDMSQRMIHDGFAVPNKEVKGGVRREALANQAQSVRRGLWAEGFVDMSDDWRSEKSGPGLSDKDKRDNVTEVVGRATATTANQAYRFLSRPSTNLFGLPVNEWSSSPIIDEKVQDIANRTPGRLETIYAQNMEVLHDLRKRKAKLTDEEKHAHDRLSLGRRAMAKALVNTGHMSEEQSRKDSHPLMSREAKRIDPKYLRMIGNATADAGAATFEAASAVASNSSKMALKMIDTAME